MLPGLLLIALIHRSARKGDSVNFGFTEFYEVRLEGVLESGNSKLYPSKNPKKGFKLTPPRRVERFLSRFRRAAYPSSTANA